MHKRKSKKKEKMIKRAAFTIKPLRKFTSPSMGKPRSMGKPAGTRVGTLDQILKGAENLKKKSGLTNTDLFSIFKHRHDAGKLRTILSPMVSKYKTMMLERIQERMLERRPRTVPWEKVDVEFLQKTSDQTEKSDPKLKPTSLEESAAPTIIRMGEGGKLYPRKLHINPGPRSRKLQQAVDTHGVKTDKNIHTTGYEDCLDCQFSECGINRKGIYAPIKGMLDGNILIKNQAWDARGTVTKAMRRDFIYTYGITDAIFLYLTGVGTGANISNVDLLFPLVSTRSVHKIRNRMQFTPIDLSIYLLRCRETSDRHPAGSIWNQWNDLSITPSDQFAPITGPDQPYVWKAKEATVDQTDPDGSSTSSLTFYKESSCQLGVTPFWSPAFNKYWECCQVIKQRLEPNDILELWFEQDFKDCHSLNNLIAWFGSAVQNVQQNQRYVPGDYEILIFFNGIPGTCAGNTENGPTLSVDALKARISKTVQHSLQFAWQSTSVTDPRQATMPPTELYKEGWITATQRTANTSRRTGYFSDGYDAILTTNEQSSTGGGV
jgi:hypothetical protein